MRYNAYMSHRRLHGISSVTDSGVRPALRHLIAHRTTPGKRAEQREHNEHKYVERQNITYVIFQMVYKVGSHAPLLEFLITVIIAKERP